MHHAHVKHKEPAMTRITLEAFHDDPHLRSRLFAAANRERSLAVRAAFAWLSGRIAGLAAGAAAHLRPGRQGRWLARLG
jgi:hypothetical protein